MKSYPVYVSDDGMIRCHHCSRLLRHYMPKHPVGYCFGVLREHAARSMPEAIA
jgi:hypothetical protein